MYEKEGILVPADIPTVEFGVYQHPNNLADDLEVFPTVARIPDAMLRKVDPTNPILVAYLQSVNPSVKIGVLLPKGIAASSKRCKSPKKSSKVDKPKVVPDVVTKRGTKPVLEPIINDVEMEVVPSKTGILKRTKKHAHRPLHSPYPRPIIIDVPEQIVFSPKGSFASKLQKIQKPHINRKGVIIHEIPPPVSPASKKRRAQDLVKKIKKNQKKL